MKTLLLPLAAILVASTLQANACNPLMSKTVPADGWGNMTSETFHFFFDENGKEVRHGESLQFDSAGNLIARAHWKKGKVKKGSVATVHMSCGIFASRTHYEDGKVVRSEFLNPQLTKLPTNAKETDQVELIRFGFVVDKSQTLPGQS